MNTQLSFTKNILVSAPIAQVWDALINPEMIKKYLFGTNTITDWKVGQPIKFTGEWDGNTYEDKGTVLQFEPQKTLQYDYWSSSSGVPDTPENHSVVTFELFERGNKTELQLRQENFKDQAACDHSEQNWTAVLQTMAGLVEGKQAAGK
jgi:uncharacterized protein YndB with AHSA1/START domain